ncbi:hypothetical protein TREPR_0128 [Treponema primitia ZAS-2]|uniref:Uncharacterized protein n=1 Tax=Treponema primitia (strain ATCC BAA-887 / DSM 12427 / ZAS-2) TaxID=545694 RepID=F5YMJ1_TREPZ|nr:hypothetical protein TREPR_0128 [Treponema primitia ZAS-2]
MLYKIGFKVINISIVLVINKNCNVFLHKRRVYRSENQ